LDIPVVAPGSLAGSNHQSLYPEVKQQIIQSGSYVALRTYLKFFESGLDTPGGKAMPFTEALRVMKEADFGPSSLCIEWSAHPCNWKGMFNTITELGLESEEMDSI
jgi:hypothetical protein